MTTDTGMTSTGSPSGTGATSPAAIVAEWGRAANARDLDALTGVYGPGAVLVASATDVITDPAAIREAMAGFLSLQPVFTETTLRVIDAGDTAVVISDWAFTGTDADGNPVRDSGRGTTVTRRQPDGSWLFLVDNPKGTDLP